VKKLIGAIVIIALAAVSARLAYMQVNNIPWLNLSRVNIQCSDDISKQTIIGSSQLTMGQSIFKQNIVDASNRLLAMPKVQTVTIKRRLPATIDIQMETEKTILLVKAERLYGLTEGQKLTEYDQREMILPLVTGIEGDYSTQSVINSGFYYSDQVKLCYAIKIYNALGKISPTLSERLSEIHFIDIDKAELYFEPNGLKVILPIRGLQQSLDRLVAIDNRGFFKDTSVIDMSGGRMINRSGV
jgi:cell division septal protein FtsQ